MKRKELLSILEIVSGALAKNDLVPIYKCFAFEKGMVRAFNDVIGVTAPCDVEGEFVVEGSVLLGLLSASQAEDIEIQPQGEDEILIKAARSNFRLPYHDLSDFVFEEPDEEWVNTFPLSNDLLMGIEACLVTSSRDSAQTALLGVNIIAHKGVVLYSSDGDAISEYVLKGDTKAKAANHMLHNAFCDELMKMATLIPEEDKGTLTVNDRWARAKFTNGYTLYGRVIENSSPIDFESQIAKTMKKKPEFSEAPKDLKGALDRARVVADRESSKTTITIVKGRMALVTETSMGVVRDALNMKHPDVGAHVSAALMQRSLERCSQMAITDRYCAFQSDQLFVIVGNMG